MDLGPALLPLAPELGVMSRWAPSLVWERLRLPSRDVTLEPEAVRERIRRVMLAEGTGDRGEGLLSDEATVPSLGPSWLSIYVSHPSSQ